MDKFPIVDISGLYSNDLVTRKKVAQQLAHAGSTDGFMYISGHRVSPTALAGIEKAARDFFAWPIEKKMEYYIGKSTTHKGYVPEGEEGVSDEDKPDRKEAFDVGMELSPYHPLVKIGTPMLGPNRWPTPEFGDSVSTYYNEVFELGRVLFRGFALGLGLDENFFKVTTPPSQLRLIHYPYDADREDVQGIGAHTDYECFTILHADKRGLWVRAANGEWIEAPPVKDAFVVNIGDIMQVLSNGRYVATPHRVKKVKEERYSFPFFCACDYDVEVKPVTGGTAQYEAIRTGDHLYAQTIQTFQYLKKRVSEGTVKLPDGSRKIGTFGNFIPEDGSLTV